MKNQLKDIIDPLIIPESFLCVHGVSRAERVLEKIQGIFDRGLYMTYKGGISSNCLPLGEYNDTDFDFDFLLNYSSYYDADSISANVIIAIPETIFDSEGTSYYIGPFEGLLVGSDKKLLERACSHPFNRWVNEKGRLMSEFILGVYAKNKDNDFIDFRVNSNYLGLKSKEEQIQFYDSIIKEMGILRTNTSLSLIGDSYYDNNCKEFILKKDPNKAKIA